MEKPESDGIAIISGSTSADGQQDPAVQKRQLENFIKVPYLHVSRIFSYSSRIL